MFPPYVLKIVLVLAALWFTYRIVTIVLRMRARRQESRAAPDVRCPNCGSDHLDSYSDADSGYCLDCKKVWGMKQG